MEFNDGFPKYEKLAQHDNTAGIDVRKHLMNVFWLLLVVTLIELGVGFAWPSIHAAGISKTWLIIMFVAFTVVKAGYIVMAFMHMGDENKWLRWSVLGAYCLFVVYFIYMTSVKEGTYAGYPDHRNALDPVKEAPVPAEAHAE